MVHFEDIILTLVGLRISRNEYVSDKVVDYTLMGCIIILWGMSMGLGMEHAIKKYHSSKEWSRVALFGCICCACGLVSAPFLPFVLGNGKDKETAHLLAEIVEIAAASIACLIWLGKVGSWLVGGWGRVLKLYRSFHSLTQTLPVTNNTKSSSITTVSVTTSTSSLQLASVVRKAIANTIANASAGALVHSSPTWIISNDRYTSETTVYNFTTRIPPSMLGPPPADS